MNGETANFSLRAVRLDDAPRIAEQIGDWEVARWLSSVPHPYAIADAEEFLTILAAEQPGISRHEAIIVEGRLAGVVGIDLRKQEPNADQYNLGYWLGRPFWGRGIMGQAAAQLTRAFFATSAETKLKSGYFYGNEASAAIQKRLGFAAAGEGLLFNRAQGRRLPHIETILTRGRFDAMQ